MRTDQDFISDGVRCAAWHYSAAETSALRPCIVMGHAFGLTRDSGLERYAEQFADAGYDALVFDFRHLGESDGHPRQIVSPRRQLDDFRAAVARARTLPGVDPERIVLWGMSLSGGQIIELASEDSRVAAVISVVGSVDMVAASLKSLRRDGPVPTARVSLAALRDSFASLRGKPPVYVPIFGRPGSLAFVTSPGALETALAAAGPTFRNQVAARAALEMSGVRPGRFAKDLPCPALFQIADMDEVVDSEATAKAAFSATGRARVRHYPCDHLDPLVGHRDIMAAHQVEFLNAVMCAPLDLSEPAPTPGRRSKARA